MIEKLKLTLLAQLNKGYWDSKEWLSLDNSEIELEFSKGYWEYTYYMESGMLRIHLLGKNVNPIYIILDITNNLDAEIDALLSKLFNTIDISEMETEEVKVYEQATAEVIGEYDTERSIN